MIDLYISGGTYLTIDGQRRIIDNGAVAVDKGRIVAIGPAHELDGRYEARRSITATNKAVMPGLIDTHGHAGHSLTKTIGEDRDSREWLDQADHIYFQSTTPEFWFADGRLSALERLKFGTTTGMAIVGSQPRTDDPVYASGTARGYQEVGVRGIVAVGPARPPWPRTMSTWDGDVRTDHEVSLEQCLETTAAVIEEWHGAADGRIRVSIMMSTLVPSSDRNRPHSADHVTDVDRAQAEGVLRLANEYGTTMHAHVYYDMIRRAYHGDLDILSPKLSLAHCTGINDEDIRILAETGATVAHAPSTRSYIRARCPVPELIDAGVTVGLATDGTAPDRSFDLFAQMKAAMTLHRVHFQDWTYMPPGKVIEMATIDAAATLGLQDELGSLEVGKRADIILLDLEQPHLVPSVQIPQRIAYQAMGQDVDTVIVNGEIVMEGRVVTTVDERAVMRSANEEAMKMVRRAGLESRLEVPGNFWSSTRYGIDENQQ